MEDAYQVLRLPDDADEAAIRQRYLELVREFPPEREPTKFAEIRAAYEAVRNPIVSLQHRLLPDRAKQSFEDIIAQIQPDVRARRLSTRILLSLGEK